MTTSRFIAAALAGLVGMGVPSIGHDRIAPAITRPVLRQSKRQLLRSAYGGHVITWGYLKHPAGTVAQAKRSAVKAKNRAKHRRACRLA